MQNKDIVEPDEGEIFDIELDENILARNLELAEENKKRLGDHNILAIDIMGSIGAGKTTLIEKLSEHIKEKYNLFVLGGDVTTTIDVDRISKHDVRTLQINTGKECHLDANLIRKSLDRIDLNSVDLLIIENVGNLICPGEFPLGAEKRAVVVSVTEGPYMVLKHPFIFGEAEVVVINKTDLAEAMEVDPAQLEKDVHSINPKAKVVFTSARRDQGIVDFVEALGL